MFFCGNGHPVLCEHVVLGESRWSTIIFLVQAWGFPVPRVSARTIARWSPSRAPSSRAPYIRNSCSGAVQAQARVDPLQATAVSATQTTSIVTPLSLETPRTACSHPPSGIERKISLLPTATRQGERVAAPLDQVWAGLCIHFCAIFQHVCDSWLHVLRIMLQLVISTSCPMAPCWSCLR